MRTSISCRCATAPACCSMPSIAVPDRVARLLRRRQRPRVVARRARLTQPGEQRLPEALTARFAAFMQHAWNPDTRRFRNFMSYRPALAGRRRLRRQPRRGRCGRWANVRAATPMPSRRRWAAALFVEALPSVENFTSPRAWAFALLGLDAYCASARTMPYAAAHAPAAGRSAAGGIGRRESRRLALV